MVMLFQPGVLRLGLFEDRQVGIGVLPQREEVLVGGAALARVATQGIGAP